MDLSSGIDLGILVTLAIVVLSALAAFFYWRGGLDEWKKGIEEWKKGIEEWKKNDSQTLYSLCEWKKGIEEWKKNDSDMINSFNKDIRALMIDVRAIKTSLEKDTSRYGMMQRKSPLVPSEKAIKILRDLSILLDVDSKILMIKKKVEELSGSQIYRDIENPAERFIEITPSVIHELVEKGEIDENKIDRGC